MAAPGSEIDDYSQTAPGSESSIPPPPPGPDSSYPFKRDICTRCGHLNLTQDLLPSYICSGCHKMFMSGTSCCFRNGVPDDLVDKHEFRGANGCFFCRDGPFPTVIRRQKRLASK